MKSLYLIPVIATLVACATPDDLRERQATYELESAKTSKKVALCIAEKWEVGPFGTTPVTVRERERGYTVFLVCGGGNACLLGDITDTQTGSKTSLHFRALGTDAYAQDAKKCQ
jgi:hypothetical protein